MRRFSPLAALWACSAAAAEADDRAVDVALVLAVDVSLSMDFDEQRAQRDGYVSALTHPAVLDATTQTGFAGLPLIEIDGSNAGGFTHGFNITAGGTTVRGFAIHGFASGNGVVLFTGDGNTIVGNFIGTNAAGTAALPNQNGTVNGR